MTAALRFGPFELDQSTDERREDGAPMRLGTNRRRVSLAAAIAVALAAGLAIGVAAGVSNLQREARVESAVTLAVTPIQSDGTTAADQTADRLTAAALRELRAARGARNTDGLQVVEWRPSMSYDPAARVVREGARPLAIDFVLEGGVETGPTGARATFNIIATSTGSVSWTRSYSLGAERGPTPDDALERVAREVAEASRGLVRPRE